MFEPLLERFNRSLKNDLENVLKNRDEQFRFFGDSFQYQVKNQLRLNRPNSETIPTMIRTRCENLVQLISIFIID
jgi:hypothetical protein